jgi:hypothetical protein
MRALRELETGKNPDSEETLHRVLARRHADGRAWRRSVRLWLPIAAVLAVSTAAVARWGSFEGARGSLPVRGNLELARSATKPPASAPFAAPPPAAPSSSEDVPVAPPPPSRIEAPLRPAPSSWSAPSQARRAIAAPPPASSAPASEPVPIEAPSAPAPANGAPSDSDVYARAHRLHFDGRDPAAALSALDDYLLRFPDGRFAPDARYNRAIDLLKLRRYAEARAALQPFADGAFGGYHRNDARELLRTIP